MPNNYDKNYQKKRLEKERLAQEKEEMMNLTQVIQKRLIRPLEVNPNYMPNALKHLNERYNDTEKEDEGVH